MGEGHAWGLVDWKDASFVEGDYLNPISFCPFCGTSLPETVEDILKSES